MSLVFVSEATGAAVYVFSNDHCPPHLSARHRGEEWIARIRFSYLNETVALWSIEPIKHAPSRRAVSELLDEVRTRLSACRRTWWHTQRTTCLEHQWVRVAKDGTVTFLAERGPGAKQVVTAAYDPDTERLRVQFSDGTIAER